jgi:hypothetical protein
VERPAAEIAAGLAQMERNQRESGFNLAAWQDEQMAAQVARRVEAGFDPDLADAGTIHDDAKTPPDRSGSTRKARFTLIPFDAIKPVIAGLYLVKGVLPRKGVVVVWGAPKCGKSFYTFDLTMHVVRGLDYRGRKTVAGAVVYCVLEGQTGFHNRVEAYRQKHLSDADDGNLPFYLMETPLKLVGDHAALIKDIHAQFVGAAPSIIVIDTLNRSITGSESSDEDMGAYLAAADTLVAAFDCCVVIVHHCGHNGERPRGHSSLIGGVDAQIAVRRNGANHVVAELELAKDMEAGAVFVSRLVPVELDCDENGDPVTSCVIEAIMDAPAAATRKRSESLPNSAKIALRALQKAIDEAGQPAPPSNTIPVKARVVTVAVWRTYAFQSGISDADTDEAKRKAFTRAHEKLNALGLIGAWTDYRWLP